MNTKIILIVLGEPNSIFSEIIGKYFSKYKKYKNKIVIVGSKNLLDRQLEKLNYSISLNEINNLKNIKKNKINIFNVNYKFKKVFSEISYYSAKYIEKCFETSLDIIKNYKGKIVLINGPISKKTFLKKKYLGITEYLSKKTKSKNEVMLIYNDRFSVSPLTTHIPLKFVSKNITKKKIYNNVSSINNFYKKSFKKKARFAVLGLNPHCETTDKFSEEEKIIIPAVKMLKKKGIYIDGPFSADTFFLKKNIINYDVAVGMYHDQVLSPIKTLFKFNAVNITIGLPFIRISPDHGPNSLMIGKNISDPSSFKYAMKVAEKFD